MNIIISNANNEPIYEQIYRQIKSAIISSELKEGDLLPSIRNLAKDLRISVITTKRAYDELEKDGYIYSAIGKGSFVAEKNTEILREAHLKEIEEHFRSEEHTSELQSRFDLVCRLLLEKKKKITLKK